MSAKTGSGALINEKDLLDNLGTYPQLKAWHGEDRRFKTRADYEQQFIEYIEKVNPIIRLFECPLGYAVITELKTGWDIHWITYDKVHVTN